MFIIKVLMKNTILLISTMFLLFSCGENSNQKSGILLKTIGIINVNLTDNTFKNNMTELVALLWGEKEQPSNE